MPSDFVVACPWLGPHGTAACAARLFAARMSGAAYRAIGARDISAVVSSEAIGTKARSFVHEIPASHPLLDLRQRGGEGSRDPDASQSRVSDALLASIEIWLDAVEHVGGVGAGGRAVEPSAVLNALREVQDGREREAPDSLIYRIARDDHGRLSALCADPRVMLRRERQQCPLGRVRELDAACMRWLDMQPGRTIEEKAGRKQQIKSIVRIRSAATLENRVLRDLMLRARSAGDTYCRENSRFLKSTRVAAVRRFVREATLAYESSVIGTVPALSGVPTPNYVLQNDRRYRHVWKTWQALLRKQQLTQSLMWWGARWNSELALLGALEALEAWEGSGARYQHRLIWRPEPHQGEFFESGAPIGSFLNASEDGDRERVDVVRSSQLARGTWPQAWRPWVSLIPDIAIVPSRKSAKPLLMWSIVVCDPEQEKSAQLAYERLERQLAAAGAVGLVMQLGGAAAPVRMRNLQFRLVERATHTPQMAGEVAKQLVRRDGELP